MSMPFWTHLSETNIEPTVMVVYDGTINSGNGGYRPLEAQDLLNIGTFPKSQLFVTSLTSGVSGQYIPFPSNFTGIPVVTATLVTSDSIIAMAISNISISGYNLSLSAVVPNNNYSVNTIAG